MDPLINRLILIKGRLRKRLTTHLAKEKAYLKKLFIPLYLFPVKLLVYFIYYPVRLLFTILKGLIRLLWFFVSFPFRGWKNFFKSIIYIALSVYLLFSLLVISDYMTENYGSFKRFYCGFGGTHWLGKYAVRVVGGYGEGSGFFISENEVLTNFHVIADEPSPKIIFQDGTFTSADSIIGDRDADLALITIKEKRPDLVRTLMFPMELFDDEPLVAVGYPLGTSVPGDATILKGRFIAYRQSKYSPVSYLQTDINLVEGMSGGPLFNKCGSVVGINTSGLAGASFFISSESVTWAIAGFTDAGIAKITVDPSTPEGAVVAFYTYLKARRMEDGFNLLSEAYLQKTNFQEWTNRFRDVLDVEIFQTKLEDERKNIVFVKFATKNWVEGEVEQHFYGGTWQTVLEEGVYKMYRSNIKEVINPEWDWYYTI